jgi:transcriptional regulator with XRE-family HTH domain
MAKNKGIGPRIQEARLAAGLSQSELAVKAGNSTSTIQSWELGSRHPRFDGLQRLAEALGRDVSWFYTAPERAAA